FVLGHVNGKAKIDSIDPSSGNKIFSLSIPSELQKYMAKEGSITVDGISLTISDVKNNGSVALSIITHTLINTNLQFRKCGDELNIEVDIIAKYIETLMRHSVNNNCKEKNSSTFKYDLSWLKENGF
ncbi:MAG: riboflavin synthase, partial [Oligoflexia bacterium]|nr:riboflavin synthase [Oligoflexia bacterium]